MTHVSRTPNIKWWLISIWWTQNAQWIQRRCRTFYMDKLGMLCCAMLRCSVVSYSFCNPMSCSPPGTSVHGDSPGKNIGVSCHTLLQGIFLTQGSNSGLLHCTQILYQLSYQGSQRNKQLTPGHDSGCVLSYPASPSLVSSLPADPPSSSLPSKSFTFLLKVVGVSLCCLHIWCQSSRTLTTHPFLPVYPNMLCHIQVPGKGRCVKSEEK